VIAPKLGARGARAGDTCGPPPLPVSRIGRASSIAGGVFARLWAWLQLPRVELFRVCARCHERMEVDSRRGGIVRAGTRICEGWTGERCIILMARSG
jgi:hypothetical protein